MFLDTTAASAEGESVTTALPRPRGFPEPSQEPPQSNLQHPTPTGPTTHELDETRSQDIP